MKSGFHHFSGCSGSQLATEPLRLPKYGKIEFFQKEMGKRVQVRGLLDQQSTCGRIKYKGFNQYLHIWTVKFNQIDRTYIIIMTVRKKLNGKQLAEKLEAC